MIKLLKIIIVFLLFFTLTQFTISAQNTVKDDLIAIETERKARIEKALLLNLPEISDNPNHIITFKDPSEKGVFLEIDGQGFEQIQSPYTLPSLSLGKHLLTFKFSDEQDTEQILERSFTIIPRPPIINPPKIMENEIIISGTAISNSKVELFLSRDLSNQKALAEVDEHGKWQHKFTEDIKEGTYTIIATTRRNGFASYNSEPVVFTIGQEQTVEIATQEEEPINFNLRELNLSQIKNSPDLLIAFITFFVFGVLITILITSITQRATTQKNKKVLQELLKKKTQQDDKSLKDKFEESKGEVKKETKTEHLDKKKEEPEDEAKSLTKKEFLENFKKFDPDNENGEEKKPKKRIKISLTAKD